MKPLHLRGNEPLAVAPDGPALPPNGGLRPDLIRWPRNHRGDRNRLITVSGPHPAVLFFEGHRGVSDLHVRDTIDRLGRYPEDVG